MRPPLLLGLAAVVVATAGCASAAGEQSAGAAAVAAVSLPPVAATAGPSPTASPTPTPVPSPPTPAPTPVVRRGDGNLAVVPAPAAAGGQSGGTTYVVELEGGLGVDPEDLAAEVDRVLADPRSWGADGRPPLRRVGGGEVAVRVALVSPATVDRLCAPLQTRGYFSCASGGRAVLNAERWLTGAPSYAGRLAQYRQYLVNHEVGHVLGHGHERCPGPGAPAPVMQQQTKGLDGCAENPWPYPAGSSAGG